jgi:hypothetical protein
MFLIPSPSPAENLDDGSMEEPEDHDIKVSILQYPVFVLGMV